MVLDKGAHGRLTLELKSEFRAGSRPAFWPGKRAVNAMASTVEKSVLEICCILSKLFWANDWLGRMEK
jgi:hypothetical protein